MVAHDFGASFHETRKSRKEHVCCECPVIIQKGEDYVYYKSAYRDSESNPQFEFQEYKHHVACWEKLTEPQEGDLTDYL